jgi:two-component system sensor histidine kinase HydH
MANSPPKTILIVDDNSELADNLREILENVGYHVLVVGSYGEALAQGEEYSVALVDVRLPDGDGTVLASELKARRPDSEIILLSGSATLESAVAAVRAGAWAYLLKPCSAESLLQTIRQAVRHVGLAEEKRALGRRTLIAEKLAAVGTLAAGLSHEIRNPLNAASLQLTLLERRIRRLVPEHSAQLLEPLDLVQHEISRLSQIVADFLQFARPREFTAVQVDLAAVVEAGLALLQAQLDEAGLRLERVITDRPQIDGDTGLLQQALINLVLNAIQATPRGGVVRVSLIDASDGIQLKIEDSGQGIPDEIRNRIFEPFFTTKDTGSGLGLPMVHSIVQQHSGAISVDDSDLGGASVTITLPQHLTSASSGSVSAITPL